LRRQLGEGDDGASHVEAERAFVVCEGITERHIDARGDIAARLGLGPSVARAVWKVTERKKLRPSRPRAWLGGALVASTTTERCTAG
jgi:hypothetical protein